MVASRPYSVAPVRTDSLWRVRSCRPSSRGGVPYQGSSCGVAMEPELKRSRASPSRLPTRHCSRLPRPNCEDSAGVAACSTLGVAQAETPYPLARLGWNVLGVELSQSDDRRVGESHRPDTRVRRPGSDLVLAPMDRLPVQTGRIDLVVAHGIWNLARSGAEFRRAVQEAARVLTPGGGLFVFTFSRHTLPPDTQPVPGESFVFTQFSGEPQCFLTEPQLLAELRAGGFAPDRDVPLRELNRPRSGILATAGTPVIYEAVFRRLE